MLSGVAGLKKAAPRLSDSRNGRSPERFACAIGECSPIQIVISYASFWLACFRWLR